MALRSPLTVQPYDYIADSNGRPLDYGQVYIGVANQDPEFYQIPVYLDAAMTKPIDQPIRTNDGFVDFAGSLSELYASAEVYSVKVLDKQGRKVLYKGDMTRKNLMSDALADLNQSIIDTQTAAQITLNAAVNSANTEVAQTVSLATAAIDTATTKSNKAAADADAAIKTLFENGGLPATPFTTKALMTASALADGKYAMVTDDTANNGLYVKTAGVWVKSNYDPLNKAINYVDLNSVTSKNDQSDLHVFSDDIGNIVATIDDKAVFNALDFATPSGNLASITKSIGINEAAPLITQADNQGNIIYELDSHGMPTAAYSFFGISEMQSGALSQKDMNKTGLTLDRMSTANDTPIDFDVMVSEQGSDDTLTQRMPSGIKISDNKMFVAFTQFSTYNSDNEDGRLVGKFITYDLEAQTASVGETRVIVGNRLGSFYRHPHFIRLKDRILLIFNGVLNEVLVYESFDECLTFTPKTINSDAFAYPNVWALALDSATLIEHGLYAGRIVLALYSIASDVGTVYSDDGGATWVNGTNYQSTDISPDQITLNEMSVTTDVNNDLIFCFRNGGELPEHRYMIFAKSKDGGKTLQFFEQDTKTGMSRTQAAIKRSEGVPKILSLAGIHETQRKGGTLRISYDSCKSFALEHILYDGNDSFGYSSILPLDTKTYALVYEDGVLNQNHSVKIKIINLKKVLN